MKIQETDNTGQRVTSTIPVRPERNRLFTGIGAIMVVIVLVSLTTLVFAQLRQHHTAQTSPMPPSGQWKQVLQGYTFISLTAAQSDPAVLYACAIRETPGASSQSNPNPIVILRSSDFGDHWQDITGGVLTGGTCQLAVNSSNSNDIYAVSYGNVMPNPAQLKHSQDGGKTWQTIVPVMHDSSSQAPIQWSIQHMQVVGNHLFGIQMMGPRLLPVQPAIKAIPYLAPRLATSLDGGHSWTIIDNQFTTQRLGVQSYAVDPNNSNTIYELIGSSLLPIHIRSLPTYDPPAIYGINQELFKSTDGGATWQSALKNIPYASQVQLASGNPQVIYVGGTLGPLPLLPNLPRQTYPSEIGSFHLQMSTNGGSSWQNVSMPSDMQSIQSWFVSAGGGVYASPTISIGIQPTIIPGTVVPATPVSNQSSSSQNGAQSIAPQSGLSHNATQGVTSVGADVSRPPLMYQPSSLPSSNAQSASLAPSQFIRVYNPNTSSWSNVTRPPTNGFMLQLTPAQSSSGALLWFVGTGHNGGQMLYRYVV